MAIYDAAPRIDDRNAIRIIHQAYRTDASGYALNRFIICKFFRVMIPLLRFMPQSAMSNLWSKQRRVSTDLPMFILN